MEGHYDECYIMFVFQRFTKNFQFSWKKVSEKFGNRK